VNSREILVHGKAKTVYQSEISGQLIVKFRDDITAFDGKKKDVLAGKGHYNVAVSAFFFRHLEQNGIKTHFIELLDDTTMLVRELDMIPLEVIVRNLAAGSIVERYPFKEGSVLDPPIIVMDLKDDSRHDPMVNDDIIVALKVLTREEISKIREISLEINEILREYFVIRGIILVDFKIEFGRLGEQILLGDEISMDSMRLRDVETGESLDKDVYRFDKGDVLSTYAHVMNRILPKDTGGNE
jgi:phosphoribosylaminoimidazole-succinocarboxamide synthase